MDLNAILDKVSLAQLLDGYLEVVNSDFNITLGKDRDHKYLMDCIDKVYGKCIPLLLPYSKNLSDEHQVLVYRLVKWNERPELISQCSYPPESCGLGRCNFPGKPIFYGANDVATAVMESDFKVGDKWVLGTWVFNVKNTIVYPMVFNQRIVSKQIAEIYTNLDKWMKDTFKGENYSKAVYLAKLTVQMFLSNNYFLSSFIAHTYLDSNVSGVSKRKWIFYPTMKNLQRGFNFALNKDLVDGGFLIPANFTYLEVVKGDKPINVIDIFKGKPATDKIGIDWYMDCLKENSSLAPAELSIT